MSLIVTPTLRCNEIHISCGTVCFLDNLLRTLRKPLEFHGGCVRWLIKSNATLTVLLNERESEMGILVFIAEEYLGVTRRIGKFYDDGGRPFWFIASGIFYDSWETLYNNVFMLISTLSRLML